MRGRGVGERGEEEEEGEEEEVEKEEQVKEKSPLEVTDGLGNFVTPLNSRSEFSQSQSRKQGDRHTATQHPHRPAVGAAASCHWSVCAESPRRMKRKIRSVNIQRLCEEKRIFQVQVFILIII